MSINPYARIDVFGNTMKTVENLHAFSIPYEEHSFSDLKEFTRYSYEQKEIVPKNEFILNLCKNKSVLDLGCIDHSYTTALELGENWLHSQIRGVSSHLVGVDLLKEDAEELNKLGYNIEVVDVENFDLNHKFDVIVAGDLIEHLSNIGMFLNCVSRHMRPDSIFVATTPNPFNVELFFSGLFRNKLRVNREHSVWIDPVVMYQLVSRSPLRIVDFKWVDTRFKLRIPGKGLLPRVVNTATNFIIKKKPILRPYFAVILKINQDFSS
jgi:2-polyprenyl-3-methyl-5-hydroxy-6-metoxy-1,4-benzoquinol methylase